MKKKIGRGVYRNSWGWVNFLNKNNDYREGKKISLVIHYIYTHRSWKYRYTCRELESRKIHSQRDRKQDDTFTRLIRQGDTLAERQKVGRYAHREIYSREIHLQELEEQADLYREIESREINLHRDIKEEDTRL